jgi:hypothetical protein
LGHGALLGDTLKDFNRGDKTFLEEIESIGMNNSHLTIVLAILVAFIIALFGLVLFLLKQLQTKNEHHHLPTEASLAPETPDNRPIEAMACVNHHEEQARGVCCVCNESFCETCLKEYDGLNFCSPHFRLYLGHEWVKIEEIKTTPDTPESALSIYEFKKNCWKENEVPSIISTHYKINIEGDFIESYVCLLVRKEEEKELEEIYQQFKTGEGHAFL